MVALTSQPKTPTMTVKLNPRSVSTPAVHPGQQRPSAAPAPRAAEPAVSRGWTAGAKPSASANAAALAARARNADFRAVAALRTPDYSEPLRPKMGGYSVEKGIPPADAAWVKKVIDSSRLAPVGGDFRNGFNSLLKNARAMAATDVPAAVRKNWQGTVGLEPKSFAAEIKVDGKSAFVVFSKPTGTPDDWFKGNGYQNIEIFDAKGTYLAGGSLTGRQATSGVAWAPVVADGPRVVVLPGIRASDWTSR